jgi:hypothetical protein
MGYCVFCDATLCRGLAKAATAKKKNHKTSDEEEKKLFQNMLARIFN